MSCHRDACRRRRRNCESLSALEGRKLATGPMRDWFREIEHRPRPHRCRCWWSLESVDGLSRGDIAAHRELQPTVPASSVGEESLPHLATERTLALPP